MVSLCIFGMVVPAAGQSDAPVAINLPAQPLGQALVDLAEQTGVTIVVPNELVVGKSAPEVIGTLVPEDAVRRLLAGSGLTARRGQGGAIIVNDVPSTTQENGPLELSPITVEGQAESAYGPVEGYLATRSATGTKTDTPILETPAAIQVVPRNVIEDQGARNLKDAYDNVSGVQQAGDTQNARSEVIPIIRGFESPVLFRNGLRTTAAGAVDLANVERVEVLKGPASILYGALEPGGVVNYVTKRPQTPAFHEIEQEVGSFDYYRTTVDTTGALTDDATLLYRTNFAYTNSGSFRDELELERVAIAPSLLWAPNDDTELLLDLSYVRETQPFDTGIPLAADGSPLVSIDTFFGDPDLDGRLIKDYVAGYQFSHRFNEVWSLRNQFQFHRADAENEAIRPGIVVDLPNGLSALSLRYQNEEQTEDEIQFVLDATADFATGPVDHTLLLGVDLIDQESERRRFRQNITPVLVSDDINVDFTPPANQPQEVRLADTQRAAFYVQDQLALLEDGQLMLLLGGRYDIVHQEVENDGVSTPGLDEEAFTGRAGLLYLFNDNVSGYVSFSQSFVPQPLGTVDQDGALLDPETGTQYEIGTKISLLDDRLLATASLFQIDKENVAVLDNDLFAATGQIAFFPGVENRSRGFEFDISGALTEEIDLLANYSFTTTEVTKNLNDPESQGDPLGGVPRHKGRLWATYSFNEESFLQGLRIGGGVRYVGESTAQFDSDTDLDSYVVFDAGAWYRWEMFDLSLNVTNLFDREYIVRASNRAIAHPGEPLSVFGSLTVRF